MSTCTASLWSTDINPSILSPRDILESQATVLRDQTHGLLTADIRIVHDEAEQADLLLLDIVVPALNGVRHRVLTARHCAERIYPCQIDGEAAHSSDVANSDAEFQDLIRQVLHSGEVKALALSLIARVRAQRKADPPCVERRSNGHRRLFRPAWFGVELEDEELNGTLVEALYDERTAGD